MDFATLQSNCNGRIVEKHYRKWENAEKELREKVKRIKKLNPKSEVITDVDEFNADKGFPIRYVEIEDKSDNTAWRIAIIENYFWD